MIIAGAGGHARELLGVLSESGDPGTIIFFDDLSGEKSHPIWNKFPVISSIEEATELFKQDEAFCIGVGKPSSRKSLYEKLTAAGGKPRSVISPFARLGLYNLQLGNGLNIMTGAVITQDVRIGEGVLVHMNATIHHDCIIGSFCEISPGAHLLGRVTLGDLVSVGAGAVLLPGVHIGSGAVIGAGAVVTKDVEAGIVVKGVPAAGR